MKKPTNALLSLFIILAASVSNADSDSIEKLQSRSEVSAEVLRKIVSIPDDTIPESLLHNATCIATFPNVIRIGFVFGARHGEGLVSCRVPGGWSNPSFMEINGGSWGLQVGISSTDLILIFVRSNAPERLSGSNFILGADASIAVGPVGRHLEAGTDYQLQSEIYAYSQTRGLFAGLTVEGAKTSVEKSSNELVYGPNLTALEIITTPMGASTAGEAYVKALSETAHLF